MKKYDEALREIQAKQAEREKAYRAYIDTLRPAAQKLAEGVDALVERDAWQPGSNVESVRSERHSEQRLYTHGQTKEMAQLVCSILEKSGYEAFVTESKDGPYEGRSLVFVVDPLRKKILR